MLTPSFRAALPGLSLAVAALALAACGDTADPLAPDATPSSAVTPAGPGELAALTSPRIVFVSLRNASQPDLYTMDQAGNNLVHLTTWSGDENYPAWSWDNKRIALVRRRWNAQTNSSHDDIYVMNADGSNKHWALATPSPYHMSMPAWSPDGAHLVVTVAISGKPYLATLEPATGTMKLVTYENGYGSIIPAQGSYPSYEPGGERILYLDGDGRHLNLVNPTNGWQYGVSGLGDTPVGRPAMSPDGKKIAYGKQIAGSSAWEIYVYAMSTSTFKRLTYAGGYNGAPTWSPDGTRLAFESNRSGQSQIWTMNSSTGGSLTRITHTATYEAGPAFSH